MARAALRAVCLALSLANCGAELVSAEHVDAGVDQAAALVVPAVDVDREAPGAIALLLGGRPPARPGVYVFTVEGGALGAPALQLRVVPEPEARALGAEVFAPSADAARWTRRPTR